MVLGEYRLIEYINKGAFSKCYHAVDKNNKSHAIKQAIYHKKYEGIRYFELREIYALIKLKCHPNIIPLKEIIFDENYECNLVLKYVPLTLNQYVHKIHFKDRMNYIFNA